MNTNFKKDAFESIFAARDLAFIKDFYCNKVLINLWLQLQFMFLRLLPLRLFLIRAESQVYLTVGALPQHFLELIVAPDVLLDRVRGNSLFPSAEFALIVGEELNGAALSR